MGSPVENYTQMEDGDDTERSGNRTDRSDHRPHCGRDFGDSVADAPSRNQPRGMAEGANSQGVSGGKTNVEARRDDVLSAGVRPGDPDGGGVGGRDLADSQRPIADKSVSEIAAADKADKSVKSADKSVANVLDFKGFKSRRLTSQSTADFDKKHWKRSRVKPGWLIRRLTGYSIVENEYGVQYLGVVSRKPDRMSADSLTYPLAGFFTWSVMAKQSLLVEERGQNARAKLG